jgi:hypothetical protein
VNTKNFGRWGEACVARYLRDKGYAIYTADAWNYTPYIDFQAIRRIGSAEARTYHIQVKATSKGSEKTLGVGFPYHYATLAKCVGYAESLKDSNEFAFCVVSLEARLGFIFDGLYLASVCREADHANGDHYSEPGMMRLLPAYSRQRFPLTAVEMAEGERIAGGDSREVPQQPLFD